MKQMRNFPAPYLTCFCFIWRTFVSNEVFVLSHAIVHMVLKKILSVGMSYHQLNELIAYKLVLKKCILSKEVVL